MNKLATATIKVDFHAGDEIGYCFEEAIRIASKLDVIINFKFNNVDCYARPDSNAKKGVEKYHKALIKESPKMAFS